jgi:Xaa-Pro aminopeptidase
MNTKMSNREYITSKCIPDPEVPFGREEFAERLERIRVAMETENIDLLFVSAPEGLYYVSGFLSDWYQAQSPMIWPPTSGIAIHRESGRTIHFETEAEEMLAQFTSVSADLRILRDGGTSMIEFITAELAGLGWLTGTVGLEMFSYRPNRGHSELFEAALTSAGARVVDATNILRNVRRIKSYQELEYMREAGRFADIGMKAARDALKVGATELDVHAEMTYAMIKAGGEPAAIQLPVTSGRKTAAPHAAASHKKIQAGDNVVVDICGVSRCYHVNLARSFSMGEPHPAVAAQIEKSSGLFAGLPQVLKPGMRVAELIEYARGYYEDQGLWEDRGWVGGYELGIALPPDWDGPFTYDAEIDPGDTTLDPGMVINLESDVYLPEGAGASLVINTMEFADESVTFLSQFPDGLQVIE